MHAVGMDTGMSRTSEPRTLGGMAKPTEYICILIFKQARVPNGTITMASLFSERDCIFSLPRQNAWQVPLKGGLFQLKVWGSKVHCYKEARAVGKREASYIVCPGQQAQKWMPGPGAFLLFCLLTCLGFESSGGVGGATRVNSSRNPHRKR